MLGKFIYRRVDYHTGLFGFIIPETENLGLTKLPLEHQGLQKIFSIF